MRKPTEVPASLKNVDVKSLLRSRGVYLQQKANKQMKELALPVARQIVKSKRKVVKEEPQRYQNFTNEEARAYLERQVHIVHSVQEKFKNKIEQFVNKMVGRFLSHLESEVSTNKRLKKFNTKDFFSDNEDDYMAEAQLDFTPLLVDQAVIAGQEALKLIKSTDVYIPGQYRAKIAHNVAKFTKSMLDTDRQKLIDIISNGIDAGQNISEIRGAIEADFANISKTQADLITQTEVSRVSVQASLDAWKQSGVVEGKEWISYGPAEDEECQHDGEVVALDGNFYDIETEFQDGDPPVHPNCMCETLPVLLDRSDKHYIPEINKNMAKKIKELEGLIDKRTKAYRELKSQKADDTAYIKSLENYLGLDNE